MGKSSSGRQRAGSESSMPAEKRRDSTRDSTTTSRRKSSRRSDYIDERDDTTVASSRTAPSTYVTAYSAEPLPIDASQDNASRPSERDRTNEARGSRDDRNSKYGGSKADPENDGQKRRSERENGRDRRDSRRSGRSDRRDSARALGDHDASLPDNQFPGEIPPTYAQPFRPPGQAAEYYGDQGESVSFQPGVRPNKPSIVTSAEQAHLMEPTVEARPPAEPSSLGQIGAAASYFGGSTVQNDNGAQYTPSKPPRKSDYGPDRPTQHNNYGVSPRSSPTPSGYTTRPQQQGPGGGSQFATSAAAEYYSGSMYQTPPRLPSGSFDGSGPYSAPAGPGASLPNNNASLYGAAGLAAGAAGAAYLSHHSNEHSHTHYQGSSGMNNPPRYSSGSTQMQHKREHKHRSPLGKFVDWFRDPKAVAEYEQYTEAIGVCKYCFDPMSTPADAPRRHHYKPRRTSSGSRYGSTTRVDKTYRYSSDEERKRRSSAKKIVVGGLAGYGAAKVGAAVLKANHDFDDTYSVKSGRPAAASRVSFQGEDTRSTTRYKHFSSTEDLRRSSGRVRESKSGKTSRHQDQRSSRRRDSSSSSSSRGISRGAALSAGVGAAGLAMGAAALNKKLRRDSGGGSRSRSRSPPSKKNYYSKRVSPMHSYVDLSTTNSGPGGITGFFTSPSANKRKGKKPKGLFTFSNASTSSSDADLAYGAGTVRRKRSTRRLSGANSHSRQYDSTAGMMGLVKLGNDLASESDRRRSKGKRVSDAYNKAGQNARYPNKQRVTMQDQAQEEEWYDTDDSDTGLVYGSGTSAVQTRQSHSQAPRYPQDHYPRDQYTGEFTGRTADGSRRHSAYNQPQSGETRKLPPGFGTTDAYSSVDYAAKPPPMQEIEPRPISNSESFDNDRPRRDSYHHQNAQPFEASSTSVPLHQPQPVVPVLPFINQSGYAPPDQDLRSSDYRRSKPSLEDAGSYRQVDTQTSGSRRSRDSRRRDSSPAKLLSQDPRNNVSFNLTDEQLENERKSIAKDDRRDSKREKKDRRKSADAALVMGAGALVAGALAKDHISNKRRSSESIRDASSWPDDREAEIERQLQALYDEKRRQDERKRTLEQLEQPRQSESPEKANAGAGVAKRSSSSEDSSGPRRKSSLKKSNAREASPGADTQQERIARMAAQRVKSTPSPTHEDYGNFFVPQELVEHLKEHNEKAEHRDDMGANVVEIIPGGSASKRRNPFDPFLYRPFGLDVDDDPGLHPWPVPRLELVEATPPGSRAGSERGDTTPVVKPAPVEPPDEVGEPLERKASNGSKVTWGDHDTYVYEVQTPEYERSDYIPDDESSSRRDNTKEGPKVSQSGKHTESRPNVGRTWTLDDAEAEVLEREVPTVSERPHVSRAWTVDDQEAQQIEHPSPIDRSALVEDLTPHVIEIKPKQAETDLPRQVRSESEDIARGTASAEDKIEPKREFYQSPFAETASDLDLANSQRPTSESSTGKMSEQPEVQDKPQDAEADLPDVRLSKSERRRLERASSSNEYDTERRVSPAEPHARNTGPADTESVFDFLVDDGGKSIAVAAAAGLGAGAIVQAYQSNSGSAQHHDSPSTIPDDKDSGNRSGFRRADTFDDSTSQHQSQSRSKTDPQSDPEDWERSRTSKKGKKSKRSAQSDIGVSDKRSSQIRDENGREEPEFEKPRRSHTESEIGDDLDRRSSASGRKRKSKRSDETTEQTRDGSASRVVSKDNDKPRGKSKRDSQIFDDDTQSIASSPADLDKHSKDKEKKPSGGFFSNIFSTNRSDVSTSSKRSSKSSKSESRVDQGRDEGSESRKKHRSRDQDLDDVASAASEPVRSSRRSSERRHKDTVEKPLSRDESLDNGFVSAEESTEVPAHEEDKSFLVKRPEMPQPTDIAMPMDTDGVSGLASEKESSDTPKMMDKLPSESRQDRSQQHDVDTPINLDRVIESDTETASRPTVALRRLSAIRTCESDSSPTTPSYPTAIPVHFRLPASSPIAPRFSMSSPIASPASPLATPRTRQGRPKSTEFAGKNIRPLYLVEVSNSSKIPSPDTSDYPPLPASIASSSHPSTEDLRAEAQAQEQSEIFTPSRLSADQFRDQARRQSYSYWHDGEERRRSPDYLDSRSATPVPGEAQRARDRENKPKPKYEFHSPSELLQDPSLLYWDEDVDGARPGSPLPSVVSTDLDYMSARSRSVSPPRARSLSRGRRSASQSRSTSASWQDAVSTMAVGALAGSALGLAAHRALREPSPTDTETQEATTPTKAEFGPRELVGSIKPTSEMEFDNRPVEAEGSGSHREIDSESTNRDAIDDRAPHGLSDTKLGPYTPPIKGLTADNLAMSQSGDRSMDEGTLPNLQDENSIQALDIEAPYTADADTGPQIVAAVKEPRKTKKDKKKQKQTQLTSALNEELLTSPVESAQIQDLQVLEASIPRDATAENLPAQNVEPELDYPDHDSNPIIGQPMESEAHLKSASLDYFGDREKLHEDSTLPSLTQFQDPSPKEISPAVGQTVESGVQPEPLIPAAEYGDLSQTGHKSTNMPNTELTPIGQALEAAVQARGLGQGTSMAEAYNAFLPDLPNEFPENEGTPLTTIAEENEPITPGVQQSKPTLERKSSKKSKRKDKKAVNRELLSESSIEQIIDVPAESSSVEVSRQPEQAPFFQPEAPEPETFAKEHDSVPNPFGNDFEVTDENRGTSIPTEAPMPEFTPLANETALEKAPSTEPADRPEPSQDADEWSMPTSKKSRKEKKDKKGKKRQSVSWEDSEDTAAPTETQVPDTNVLGITQDSLGGEYTGPVEPQPTDMLQADLAQQGTQPDPTLTETVSVQGRDVDQVLASLPEPDDPWEMGAKKGKKSKKTKRKSLTWADEENLSTYADPPAEGAVDHSADSVFGSDQSDSTLGRDKGANLNEQVLQKHVVESAENELPAQMEDAVFEAAQEPAANIEATKDVQDLVEATPTPAAKDELESTAEEPGYLDDASSVKSPKKSKKKGKKRDSDALLTTAAAAAATAAAVGVAGALAAKDLRPDAPDSIEPVAAEAEAGAVKAADHAASSVVDSVQENLQRDNESLPVGNPSDPSNEPSEVASTTPENATSPIDDEGPGPARDLQSAGQPLESASSEQDNEASLPQPPTESPAITAEQEPEDLFPVVSKKSKKDKKKKRQSTFDEPVTSAIDKEVSRTATDNVPIGSSERDNEAIEMQPSTESPALPIEQEPEDLFPVVSKKSKKDKKKKRQSTFDEPVPSAVDEVSRTVVDSATTGSLDHAETSDPKAISLQAQESEPLQAADQEDADDFGLADRKRSKKEKKKTRQSTFDDIETPAEYSLPPVETSTITPAEDTPETPAVLGTGNVDLDQQSSTAPFYDEFAIIGRRSKKDKQRKRASATQADTPEQQDTLANIGDSEVPIVPFTTKDTNNETEASESRQVENPNQEDSATNAVPLETTSTLPSTADTEVVEPKDDLRTVEHSVVETPAVEPSPEAPVVETPTSVPVPDDSHDLLPARKDLEEEPYRPEIVVGEDLSTDLPKTGPLVSTEVPGPASELLLSESKPTDIAAESQDDDKLTTGDASGTQPANVEISETEIPATGDTLSGQQVLDDGAGDEWAVTSKKSKKDKKKKKQNISADVDREAETLQDASQSSIKESPSGPALLSPADQSGGLDTDEIATTVTSQDNIPAEDDLGSSTKKSKKDKKKKRQSLLTSPSNEPEVPIHDDASKSEDLATQPIVVAEPSATEIPSDPAVEDGSSTQPQDAAEDDWGFSSKKSKKEKKKKRQSLLTTPPNDPDNSISDNVTKAEDQLVEPIAAKGSDLMEASSDSAIEGGSSTQPDPSAEDDWGLSTKKGKKDKKKKRQSGFESSTPATETAGPDTIASTVQTPIQDTDEIAQIDDSIGSTKGLISDVLFTEPDAVVDQTPIGEAEDELWPVKSKKSKDKKKSKFIADLPGSENDKPSNATETPTEDTSGRPGEVTPEDGTFVSAKDDTIAHPDPTVRPIVDQESTVTGDSESRAADEDTTLGTLVDAATTVEMSLAGGKQDRVDSGPGQETIVRDDDVFTTKSSKKDKKKKKKSQYDWDDESNPLDSSKTSNERTSSRIDATREMVSMEPDLDHTEQVPTLPSAEGAHPPLENSGADEAGMDLVEDDITKPSRDILEDDNTPRELVQDPGESLDIPQQNVDLPDSGPPAQEADDLWASSSKKSKKDKKKSRKSTQAPDTLSPNTGYDDQSQQIETTSEAQQPSASIDAPSKEETEHTQPPEAAMEDEWSFPSNPKKGSKKSRKSTFDSSFDTSVPSTTPDKTTDEATDQLRTVADEPEDTKVRDVEPLAEPADGDADEIWSSDKKSKKQKQRDQKSVLESSFDALAATEGLKDTGSAEEAANNKSPGEDLNTFEKDRSSPTAPIEDDWAPTKKSKKDKKKKRQSTLDEPISNEGDRVTIPENQTSVDDGDTTVAPLISLADQETRQTTKEAAEEDEWAPTTKKSKKDKKKKRQSTVDEFVPNEGAQATTPAGQDQITVDQGATTVTPHVSFADEEITKPATEVVEEDEWAPTKKSKKDKKKKRQSTFDNTLDEVDSGTPTTGPQTNDEVVAVDPTVIDTPETTPEEAIAGSESKDELVAEPDEDSSVPLVQSPLEGQEKNFASVDLDSRELATESSPNDMGTSSHGTIEGVPDNQAFQEDLPGSTDPAESQGKSVDIGGFVPVKQEAISESVEDGIKPGVASSMTSSAEPGSDLVHDGAVLGTETLESLDKGITDGGLSLDNVETAEPASGEPDFEEATVKGTQPETEFTTPVKKSKKDKKKKRTSTFEDSFEEPEQGAVNAPEQIANDTPPTEPAVAVEPEAGFVIPSKKSKKEKKKKRQSTFDDAFTDQQDTVEGSKEDVVNPPEHMAIDTPLGEPAPEVEPEAEFVVPSKKSKKEKKKNRQSAFDDAFTDQQDTFPSNSSEQNVTIEPGQQPSSSDPAQRQISNDGKTEEPHNLTDKTIPTGILESEISNAMQPECEIDPNHVEEGPDNKTEAEQVINTPQIADLSASRSLDIPGEDATLESRNLDDVTVAEPEWAFSSKKSKKDKKKRQSTFNETVVKPHEDDAATFGGDAPIKDANEMPLATQLGTVASTPEQYHALDPVAQEEELVLPTNESSQHNAPAEFEFETPKKKSKKDKKKSRQSTIVQNDLEAPQSREESADTSRHGVDQDSVAISGDKTVDSFARSGNLDRAESIERSAEIVQQEASDKKQLNEKEASLTDQTALDSANVSEKNKAATEENSTVEGVMAAASAATVAAAVLEPEWATPSKKSKKEKKKKRQSTFGEDTLDTSTTGTPLAEEAPFEDIPAQNPVIDESAPTEDWGFSGKKSKKNKKRSKLEDLGDDAQTSGTGTPRSTDQFDTAVQTPLEQLGTTQTIDKQEGILDTGGQAEPPSEDYFPAVDRKKSKKDKKKKKTSPLWAEADDQVATEPEGNATSIPEVEDSHAQGPVNSKGPEDSTTVTQLEESASIVLPREMDLDDRSQPMFHDEADRTRQHESHLPHNPDPSRELQFEEFSSSVAMRPQDEPIRDDMGGVLSSEKFISAQPETTGDSRRGIDLIEQSPVTDAMEPPRRTKSKKSKKEKRIFEFNGTEMIDAQPLKSEDEMVSSRSTGTLIDNEVHSVDRSLDQSNTHDQKVYEDPETLSDVSATTRERRKRRRSPPAWAGEEPEDLPRNRSLTPPPEHDDLMDTALGVAAGLGFGAAAHESTRSARPRSSSPTRRQSTGWSFAKLGPGASLGHTESNRDSGVQFESPVLATDQASSNRDSGFVSEPSERQRGSKARGLDISLRPPRPQSPTSSTEDVSSNRKGKSHKDETSALETPRRQPTPIDSTSKERSSVLFNSSPAVPTPLKTNVGPISPEPVSSPLRRSPSIHGHHHSREELKQKGRVSHDLEPKDTLASNLIDRSAVAEVRRDAFSPGPDTVDRAFVPNRLSLNTIREDAVDSSAPTGDFHPFASPPLSLSPHPRGSRDNLKDVGLAAAVGAGGLTALALSKMSSRDSDVPHAKSLGKSKSRTSSLRNLRANAASPYDAINAAAGPSHIPVNESEIVGSGARDRDMSDIYDGYGSYPGSPRSPTRPPSVRRRQSMQQIKDLETRLDQLANENRALVEAKILAEQQLEAVHFERNRSENTGGEGLQELSAQLQDRDAEISHLKEQVASLVATHETLQREHEQNLATLQSEREHEQLQWGESTRELEVLRSRHTELSQGMESIVRHEIDTALAEKNAEIQRLREDLEVAREKVRELQSQILAGGADEVLTVRDEDYFDSACQQLCQQVQGWVLRFSKYSDTRLCRTTNEVRDEKIVDRFDNAILDGSDVDLYLADRVKRRDVFMSVVMTMIWEYVFTRYLFGMDRDQRQKLKQLEKNLTEVGPASAVQQWRALTLTLLSKRESFQAQRDSDAEAVSLEIFSTLSRFLPPPQNLEGQIVGTLRNVMHTAVNLSIEMRIQRAEYIMLPPLQPEYDTNGDLARKVYFNASLMNERSGETTSNDELEKNQEVVRMVLFPLVVKKGDDTGVGDEEIVVCPAQVLIARPDKGKKPRGSTRVASGESRSLRAVSTHSLGAMSGIGDANENMI